MSLRRDGWLGFLVVPFGWMTWASFIYAGAQARRPLWLATGALYLLITVAAIVLVTRGDGTVLGESYQGMGTILTFLLWIFSSAHAISIRPELHGRVRFQETAEALAIEATAARDLVRRDPELARALGVGRPDRPDAQHFGLIDVNHVPAGILARLPGLDDPTLRQITELRPFSSLEDLGSALDLSPQVVEELRPIAVFVGR